MNLKSESRRSRSSTYLENQLENPVKKMSRFNLRKRARVCYYEPEEPPFDEYVFCTECRDYVYEYCSIHGPLLVIPDDKVGASTGFPAFVPRAALTIPRVFLHLAYSRIPEAGLGVFSTLTLPSGVRFGPYRGQRVQSIGDSNYGWQIYDRDHKPLHIVDARDPNNSNWMRYVNCSRHHAEQNLVAYQYQGHLYYRTVKVVPRYTELLVFYGSEFANWLGVDLRGYRGPCPCPACQARLAAKKTESTKTNKRKAPVEEKKEKPSEKIAKKNQEVSAVSQDDLPSNTGIQDTSPETPAVSGSSNKSKMNTFNVGINFKCDECGKGFDIKSDLEKHLHTHMLMKESRKATKAFTCKSCNCVFDTQRLLIEHDKSHHGVKYFACDECEFATKETCDLQAHLKSHTGEKPFKCSQCSAAFAQSSHLQLHLRTHTGEKPFKCSQCSSAFANSSNLQKHLRTHTGEKPFKCSQCSSAFARSSHLHIHLRTHTGEKPFKCSQCSAAFAHSNSLQNHLRTHTGEKPFKCSQCSAAFAQSGSLQMHLRTHTGEKPFKCSQCSAAFAHSNSLQNHLRTHTGEKPFKCSQCSAAFAHSSTLQNHFRTHTGEKPFKCSQCSAAFAHSSTLQKHLRTHTGEKPFKCSQCSAAFARSSDLQMHLRTHTVEKPFECNICDYKTSHSGALKEHLMARHSGQKPFGCDACSYRGATKRNLRIHMKKHHKAA